MDSTPAPTTASTMDPPALDWSEDAATIPIIPIFPKNQPHCDLSALCTTNLNPFSSLAHWNQCHHLPLENCNISRPSPPFQLVFESPVRSGYWVPRGSNRDRDRLGFVPDDTG